jgi:hypothetical protein
LIKGHKYVRKKKNIKVAGYISKKKKKGESYFEESE